MKKIMLTTALASVLATSAFAQTTITGELRINYKDVGMDKGQTGILTKKDTNFGFGAEQQINIQTKGKLNVGGLDYAAGFSIENDGEQTGTLFNENVYMDLINASSGTTVSFGRDHIQRSDSDFSATNLVGFTPNELSQINNATNGGTSFSQTTGAGPSQSYGAALVQSTPFGTFSYNFVPNNAKAPSAAADTTKQSTEVTNASNTGVGSSETTNINTTTAYEYGFVGGLGVKGLQVHYFKNANNDFAVNTNEVKAEGRNYGVKYNFGQVTVAANKKKNQAETTTALKTATDSTNTNEITETAYAVAYAVSPNLTVGAIYAKADLSTATLADQKTKGINIGYALGPVDLAVGYAKNTDSKGLTGNDVDVFMARLIGKF
jgi:hypothetical protein